MKGISKLGLIGSKFLEILHFVVAAFMAVMGVCSVVAGDWLSRILSGGVAENGRTLVTYGFEVTVADASGMVDMTLFLFFCIGAVIFLSLFGFVFRSVYIILKRSEKGTPFQKDNIRKLKQIGMIVMLSPILGVIFNGLICLAVGAETVELSMDLGTVFLGILILCLTQYFAHGMELEHDVEGLL